MANTGSSIVDADMEQLFRASGPFISFYACAKGFNFDFSRKCNGGIETRIKFLSNIKKTVGKFAKQLEWPYKKLAYVYRNSI